MTIVLTTLKKKFLAYFLLDVVSDEFETEKRGSFQYATISKCRTSLHSAATLPNQPPRRCFNYQRRTEM